MPMLLASVLLTSCLSSRAQLDRRHSFGGEAERVPISEVPVRGYEVSIEVHDGTRGYSVSGELLAVDRSDLWVLESTNEVRAVPRLQIVEVTVEVYSQSTGGLLAWSLVGTASTISHGIFLVFSAPVWLVTGLSATANAEATDDLTVQSARELDQLTQFSRFPQGLPSGFRAERIRVEAEWLGSYAETAGTEQ